MSNINSSSLSAVFDWGDGNVDSSNVESRVVNNERGEFLASLINR